MLQEQKKGRHNQSWINQIEYIDPAKDDNNIQWKSSVITPNDYYFNTTISETDLFSDNKILSNSNPEFIKQINY